MRLRWIDTLKGFGIILVVFAHHSLPLALNTYIYSFHMPLFFFISGFLFNFGKYAESFDNFVKGRFRSLVVSYFSFALLTYLFYFLMDKVFQPEVTNIDFFEVNALTGIYSILCAPGDLVSYNPPLWFLPCLFVTELLFYVFAKKYYGKSKKLAFWLTAVGVVGYLYYLNIPVRLPWNAEVALTAVVFYGAGNLFKKYAESEVGSGSGVVSKGDLISRKKLSPAEKIFLGVFLLLSLLYLRYLMKFPTAGKMNMNGLEYGNFFLYYLLAFLGIFTFVYLFKKIGTSRILEYYGRNSLIVLGFHFPVMDILTTLIFFTFRIDLDVDYHNAFIALSLTVLNLLCLVPVIHIINNYFHFILGKDSSKRVT
jgi:acyltransferase